jgi:hypothetical protein
LETVVRDTPAARATSSRVGEALRASKDMASIRRGRHNEIKPNLSGSIQILLDRSRRMGYITFRL